jgi:chromate transporter
MAQRVWEVASLFLKLGATAFGGPAAHIALMRRECVERRNWLSERDFLDLLGAVNLIPGPNSTEMAMHIGYLRAGWPGFFAAGLGFIAPAMLMVSGAARMYMRSGSLPQIGWLLYGVKPVVVALIAQAAWNLRHTALADAPRKLVFLAALALYFAGARELALLGAAALVGLAVGRRGTTGTDGSGPEGETPQLPGKAFLAAGAAGGMGTTALAGIAAVPFSLAMLFLKFLKIGSVLFGSGYVLLPFLRAEFVQRAGWLSESQVMDAVSVGQATPGPFFTTATFIGQVLGGWRGGLLATLGIFLPAFFFVAVSNPWLPRLRRSRALGRALDGVNAASLALMAGAAWRMGQVSVTDWTAAAILAAAAYLLFRRNAGGTWVLAAGGVAGVAAHWF